jgi:hypothetical protein
MAISTNTAPTICTGPLAEIPDPATVTTIGTIYQPNDLPALGILYILRNLSGVKTWVPIGANVADLNKLLGLVDVEYWVNSAAGSNSNSGSQSSPFQTLAYALSLIPANPRKKCRIRLVGAGPYTLPAFLSGVEPYGNEGQPLMVCGDAMTQVATGTVQSVSSATLTPTVGGMTADAYRGLIYHGLTGTSTGKYYQIANNSATQLTSIGNTFGAAGGDTFEILRPITVLSGASLQINGSGKVGFWRCTLTLGSLDVVAHGSVLWDACEIALTGRYGGRLQSLNQFGATASAYDFLNVTDIGTQSGQTGAFFSGAGFPSNGIRMFDESEGTGFLVSRSGFATYGGGQWYFLGLDVDVTGGANSSGVLLQEGGFAQLNQGYHRLVLGGADGVGIAVAQNSFARLTNAAISITQAGVAGIDISIGGAVEMDNVSGSAGNAVGVWVHWGGVLFNKGGNTLTGSSGNIKVDDDATTITWAQAGFVVLSNAIQLAPSLSGSASAAFPLKIADTIAVSVRDYGATGDGITDDGPAVRAAMAAVANASTMGMKKLFWPAGQYRISSNVDNLGFGYAPVTYQPGLTMEGVGSGSVIIADVGAGNALFRFDNFLHFVVRNLLFRGFTTSHFTDCGWLGIVGSIQMAVFEDCTFLGIGADDRVLWTINSDIILERCDFDGSVGVNSVLKFDPWSKVELNDINFSDNATFGAAGIGKVGGNANQNIPGAWLEVGTTGPLNNAYSQGTVTLRHVRCDENAYAAIKINGGGVVIQRVLLEDVNASACLQAGAAGVPVVDIRVCNYVEFKGFWAGELGGGGALQRDAISLVNVSRTLLNWVQVATIANDANRIVADSDCIELHLKNMIQGTNYRTLASSAKATHIEVTSGGCRTPVNDAIYVATIYDELIAMTALTAPRTVTLPDPTTTGATSQSPKWMYVQDESGNGGTHTITIASAGGATVFGKNNVNSNHGRTNLYTQGTAWYGAGV